MQIDSENVEEFFEKLRKATIEKADAALGQDVADARAVLEEKVNRIIDASKSRITCLEAAKIIAEGGTVYSRDFYTPHDNHEWGMYIEFMGSEEPDALRSKLQAQPDIYDMKKGKYRLIVIVEPLDAGSGDRSN